MDSHYLSFSPAGGFGRIILDEMICKTHATEIFLLSLKLKKRLFPVLFAAGMAPFRSRAVAAAIVYSSNVEGVPAKPVRVSITRLSRTTQSADQLDSARLPFQSPLQPPGPSALGSHI